ncbi:MAG: hypothetical protein PHR77_03705 [Kiritimatiellae bacterium]|nr:hypothetical protein [Kiritimatiellia bacterium]MDD5522679.1 hypothetical protein [Kiritimatiellia bacterium]
MLYIVLGMHKSGTTLVAEILHRSGIRMVEEGVSGLDYDAGNKYERSATQRLNKDILKCHNIESYEIALPNPLSVSVVQRHEMNEIVRAANATGEDWGFKDPRTCLTYQAWKPSLLVHRLIVVYRHPSSVSAHYRDQSGMLILWRVLRSWSLHNRQLLKLFPCTTVPILLLNYERLMEEQSEFNRLVTFVDRPLVDARNSNLNRKKPIDGVRLMFVNYLIDVFGGDSPLGIFQELETIRRSQISGPTSFT